MTSTEAGIKLSICIPTYNFGAFIGETLASIICQLQSGVEIVVLDGGSTDNTEEIVDAIARAYPEVSYIRQSTRGGIDRDMARTIDLAHGEYCWLFSSDDIMKPGAIERVLAETASGHDVYLCGLTLCDRNMAVISEHKVSQAPWGSIFQLRDKPDRLRYFRLAETTTAFFSFMGSLIIKRAHWQDQFLEEPYIGSCWAHVVRLLRLIPAGLTLKYLGYSLLLKRGDNDSFMDQGLIHRYAIAIDGYHRIARDIFGQDSIEARHMRRVIVNEFPANAMLFAKDICLRKGLGRDLPELDRLAKAAYSDLTPRNIMRRALYRLLPVSVYVITRRIYKRLLRRPRTVE